jgi:hypothetical protein
MELAATDGIGAGGRAMVEDVTGGAAVALTRLANGSAGLDSTGFGSDGNVSGSFIATSTGRGRGSGLAGAAAAGIVTPEANIGAG